LQAYALHEHQARRLRSLEKRKSHAGQARRFHRDATRLVLWIARLGDSRREGWCSACLTRSAHRRLEGTRQPAIHLCENCGAPTALCAVPGCSDFASRGTRAVTAPLRYCAPHRHDVPSFDKLERPIALSTYREWLAFEKRNAARISRIASVSVASGAILMPMAFVAAPAIGGATGALTGLTGAAATSHGLALWGGGALAAGGLGMAGGTVVISAVGGALGGALGAAVTSAYVRTDDSFAIEKLRDGIGSPVLYATGFLTDGQPGWSGWERLIDTRYPNSPVYRVHWGAKELKSLPLALGAGAGIQAIKAAVRRAAAHASKKSAGRMGPLGPVLLAADVARNPWSVARTRSEMTGAALADILARADEGPYILMGHSLGARVMATATQLLGTRFSGDDSRVESVHLLGAAVSRKGDWWALDAAVQERVWNYHSRNDQVLKLMYQSAEFGGVAAGRLGFRSSFARITDRDVTRKVDGHSKYVSEVTLSVPRAPSVGRQGG
jgi:pimeloyl-ACP methyl ester carboxylesterase